MDFRKWVENNRVDRLLCRLIDCRADLIGLAEDLSLVTEAEAKEPPKSLLARLRKRFGNALKDTWRDELNDPTSPVNWASRGVQWVKSRKKQPETNQTPEEKLDSLYNQLQTHASQGYHDDNPKWRQKYDTIRGQIHDLSNKTPIHATATDDVQVKLQKAKGAIATLRDVLSDPKFNPILNHLEQEVDSINKPDFYNNMTSGEQNWYNRLNDTDRQKFDAEMNRSGNQNIDQGNHWWDVAASRADKAAHQGYQNADDNWRWAAGFANRQRIRSAMNPEWEKELQGEALTPGGKMFREWLKKRVIEDTAPPPGGTDPSNQPSNVMAPTDPKVIAQRKATNDLTAALMKRNPKLKPGGTDPQTVANMMTADPQLAKTDTQTQQAVSSFFIKQ